MSIPTVDTKEYERLREEALKHLVSFSELSGNNDIHKSRDTWFAFLEKYEFLNLYHKTSLREIRYPEDDVDEWPIVNFDFYDREYMEQTWRERHEEGLCGERCYIVGGFDDADEFLMVGSDLSKGWTLINHEEAFCSKDLDKDVENGFEEYSNIFRGLSQGRGERT